MPFPLTKEVKKERKIHGKHFLVHADRPERLPEELNQTSIESEKNGLLDLRKLQCSWL